jgi:hypothetical protein
MALIDGERDDRREQQDRPGSNGKFFPATHCLPAPVGFSSAFSRPGFGLSRQIPASEGESNTARYGPLNPKVPESLEVLKIQWIGCPTLDYSLPSRPITVMDTKVLGRGSCPVLEKPQAR